MKRTQKTEQFGEALRWSGHRRWSGLGRAVRNERDSSVNFLYFIFLLKSVDFLIFIPTVDFLKATCLPSDMQTGELERYGNGADLDSYNMNFFFY
jgi:hypothetical protein